MVTKQASFIPFRVLCYVLAKIQMVTKRVYLPTGCTHSYVLAKIQMVTKHASFIPFKVLCYVLAKIQMVTKPQINIIII